MLALIVSMFTLGLVTSIHCVSMCGPMVVTYALKGEEHGPWYRKLIPNAAYQGAKLVSYMLVGVVFGTVGSAFNLDAVRPYIMFVAGGFMIVMGLGMTGKFPWAQKLTPRPPKFLVQALTKTRSKAKADAEAGQSSLATPVTFGLLTGLMPCAPLMAAELAAAGAGSTVAGAIAMLAFGVGTAPLMLLFGTASSMLPSNLKHKLMSVLAIVVIIFGGVYLNRAATRLGLPVNFNAVKQAVVGAPAPTAAANFKTGSDGVAEVPLTIQNTQFQPQALQIPADKPVRLIVDRKENTACSDQLSIPQLGVLKNLKANGVTTIDLPASKAGQFTLTCGMGMMSGLVLVGGGGVASAPSPVPWLLLTLASVAGILYVSRGLKPAEEKEAAAPAYEKADSRSRTSRGTSSGSRSSQQRRGSAGSRRTTGRTVTPQPQVQVEAAEGVPTFAGLTPKQVILAASGCVIALVIALAAYSTTVPR